MYLLVIYSSVKVPLKKILSNSLETQLFEIIQKAVLECNEIYIQVCLFMKAYILFKFEKNEEVNINIDFIHVSIACITKNTNPVKSATRAELFGELRPFYYEYFHPRVVDFPSSKKLSTTLLYMEVDILKNINNNIQLHFHDHLKRYVEMRSDKIERIRQINVSNGIFFNFFLFIIN